MIKRDIIISKRRLMCLSPTRRLKLLSSAARVFLAVRINPFSCLRSYSRDTVSDEVFRRAFSPDINSVYSAFSFRLSPDHVSLCRFSARFPPSNTITEKHYCRYINLRHFFTYHPKVSLQPPFSMVQHNYPTNIVCKFIDILTLTVHWVNDS